MTFSIETLTFGVSALRPSSDTQGIGEDLEYHAAIAQATHNEFFIAAWNASRAHIRFLIELARNLSTLRSPNHSAAVRSSHEPRAPTKHRQRYQPCSCNDREARDSETGGER